jgi:hypothetical protein
MLKVLVDEAVQEEAVGRSSLDEIARDGARRMRLAALETEVARNVEAHVTDRHADDHAAAERLRSRHRRMHERDIGLRPTPANRPGRLPARRPSVTTADHGDAPGRVLSHVRDQGSGYVPSSWGR